MPTYLDTLPTELLHHIDRQIHRIYMHTLRYELLEFILLKRSHQTFLHQSCPCWLHMGILNHSWTHTADHIIFKSSNYFTRKPLHWHFKERIERRTGQLLPDIQTLISQYPQEYAHHFTRKQPDLPLFTIRPLYQ